jgi:hypothetical protein
MAGILSLSPFQNLKPHPQIRSKTPEITRRSSEVVPTLASNYFRSMCRRRNPIVPLCLSRRELRPSAFDSSIRPTVHPQPTFLCLAPARVIFSGEPPPLLYLGFLRVLRFPVHTGPPSPSSTLPRRWRPSPLRFHPRGPLPSLARAPRPPLRPPLRARATCGRACGGRLVPPPCVAPSPHPPPSMVERNENRGGRR